MEKISYWDLRARFRDAEQNGRHIHGCIVFTEDSFDMPYSLNERTYCVSSNNKAFQPNMGGYSIYAGSKDGSDPCVRLEGYMADEGVVGGWTTEYCYIPD